MVQITWPQLTVSPVRYAVMDVCAHCMCVTDYALCGLGSILSSFHITGAHLLELSV